MSSHITLNPAQPAHAAPRAYSTPVRAFQWLYVALVSLFALGVAMQAYLAGLSIFANSSYIQAHTVVGFLLQFITLLLLPLALLGRFPRRVIGLHGLLLLDIIFQVGLVTFLRGFALPALTAVHAANALVLFLLAVALAARARRWVRQARASGAAK